MSATKNKTTGSKTSLKTPLLQQNRWQYIIPLLLAGLCILMYYASLKNAFLAYDDPDNVLNNMLIRKISGANFIRYFTTPLIYMYTPFVYISFAFDYRIAGLNPMMYHATNLILHICNTLLVFYAIRALTKRTDLSIISALLFACSPLNVDSVAWISTRGTLLFTFFFLLSIIGYVVYTETKRTRFLVFSIIAFLFSCFSKSTAITLPLILLVIDLYTTQKITRRALLKKIPYFVVAVIFGTIALFLRTDTGVTHAVANFNYLDRFFMFTYSIDMFLLKLAVPFNISAINTYPAKLNGLLPTIYYFSPIMLAGIVFCVFKFAKNRNALLCALLIFMITLSLNLLPLLEDGYLASRYAYLPSVGFGLFIALLYAELEKTKAYLKFNKVFMILFVMIMLMFSFISYQRTRVWNNTFSLFNDVIEKNADNVFAYNSRGIAKYEKKDLDGSIADFSKAVKINPSYDGAYYNRAISYYESSQTELALNDYDKAIVLNTNFAKAYDGRGILYMETLNKLPEAISDFTNAVKINPDFAQAYYNRGVAYAKTNNFDKACSDWKQVQRLGYDRANEFIEKYCK